MAGNFTHHARLLLSSFITSQSSKGQRHLLFQLPFLPSFYHPVDRPVGHRFWAFAIVCRLSFAHEEPSVLSRNRVVIPQPQAAVSSSRRSCGRSSGDGRPRPLFVRTRFRRLWIAWGKPNLVSMGGHDKVAEIIQSERSDLLK